MSAFWVGNPEREGKGEHGLAIVESLSECSSEFWKVCLSFPAMQQSIKPSYYGSFEAEPLQSQGYRTTVAVSWFA
jgi:hypothetical protein